MVTDKRTILYVALLFVGFMLWQQWQLEHAPKTAPSDAASQVADGTGDVPMVPASSAAASVSSSHASVVANHSSVSEVPESRTITVSTDKLQFRIDRKGGTIISAKLPEYPDKLHQPDDPVTILTNQPSELYIAQSGVMGKQGPDTAKGQVIYQSGQSKFNLADGQNELNVTLSATTPEGVKVNKTFNFKRGSYAVDVDYQIKNQTNKEWSGHYYAQIRHKKSAEKSNGFMGLNTYRGAAVSSHDKPYLKIPYKKMDKEDFAKDIDGGWLAMQQRYFLSAWVPEQKSRNHYFTRKSDDDVYTIGYVGPTMKVVPGETATVSNKFYVGPELEENLKPLAPNLELTIDYGWLWMISSLIFWVMKNIYNIVGNWGWSIILVTLAIKLVFYKLSESSYKSMAKMRDLQPRMEQLKQRFSEDRQKLSQATMELYKKEKVNPVGGCLPMLIQIPVFIALYYVLIESVYLRHAPFMFWIQDLSSKDPYYVLPLLMGVSMYAQQLLNPPPPDPMQAKMMRYGLPVMFTALFASFPSGLVLYWLANNVLSIVQQWYIMNKHSKKS